ncbi:MAG: M48 family metalloprotease [Candidatus Lambdaproteobacteria bacterium]|nr:M48 family metalloprotease [Candidatus Lambdaproteobacteria bacterium]
MLTHRLNNWLQATLLIAGMGGLLLALGLLLGGALGAATALAFGTLFALFSPRISPALILRMYQGRRLHPAEAPGLFEIVGALAGRARLGRMPDIYYIPTRVLNAFTVGGRGETAIAVTDGLLRGLSPRELTGVLAHEVSHVRGNDMWIMALADSVSRLVGMLALTGQVLFLINLPMLLTERGALPWLPILVLLAAPTVSALLQLALSRNREFDADAAAAALTGDPAGLASALQRLEWAQGRFWEELLLPGARLPDPSLLRTHPRTEERVGRLRELAAAEAPIPTPRTVPGFLDQGAAVLRAPHRRWHGLWY